MSFFSYLLNVCDREYYRLASIKSEESSQRRYLEMQEKLEDNLNESGQIRIVRPDPNVVSPKLRNFQINRYIQNTSDELRKRFSFKCIHSPDTCSKVVESYGSDVKAFCEIKDHIIQCHLFGDSVAEIKKKKILTSSADKIRPLGKMSKFPSEWSAETAKTNFEEGLNKGKSDLPERADEEEIVSGILSSYSETADVAHLNTANVLPFGQSEHDYSKIVDEQHTAKPPVHGPVKNKNQRVKGDVAYNKWVLNHLSKHMNGDAYLMPPVVATAPFPFVYVPQPPEPVLIVELNADGDPVNGVEPTFFESSANRISSKKAVQNKTSRKKAKFSQTANECRSVLECVENRVTCKPSASSVSKDALVANTSIENSENVEKSIHEIAWKNIRILGLQRRKRKCPNKISDYMCEICKKKLTAVTSLTYHYLGHLKIKPFKCNICSRRFTRRHSLKYHMMIHANANRFQCNTCKRLFRHPSHYKEHLRKHTGEEPYLCKFCSNKFKTRNSFKRHLKMQHQKNLTSNGIVPIHNDS